MFLDTTRQCTYVLLKFLFYKINKTPFFTIKVSRKIHFSRLCIYQTQTLNYNVNINVSQKMRIYNLRILIPFVENYVDSGSQRMKTFLLIVIWNSTNTYIVLLLKFSRRISHGTLWRKALKLFGMCCIIWSA